MMRELCAQHRGASRIQSDEPGKQCLHFWQQAIFFCLTAPGLASEQPLIFLFPERIFLS